MVRVPSSRPWATVPVVAVCGHSGAGKTTLLEELIPRLVAGGLGGSGLGLRVAVIKHDAHGIDVDRAGKDSDRLFRAGATVLLEGPDETMRRTRVDRPVPLQRVIEELGLRHDLVLVEGHSQTPLPKIWLLAGDETAPPEGIREVVAVLGRSEDRLGRALRIVAAQVERAWAGRPLVGAVLVGGRSRRMGRPKQLIEVDGKSLVERAAQALGSVVGQVVLLGDGPLPDGLEAGTGSGRLLRLADVADAQGPLAGLLAARRWAPGAAWLVMACDQPLAGSEALGWLKAQRQPGVWAIQPRTAGGRIQPLLAVYEPQGGALLEDLAAIDPAAGPSGLAGHERVQHPQPPEALQAAWCSADTPAGLAALTQAGTTRTDDSGHTAETTGGERA